MDADGVANGVDLCPQNPDPQQSDKDGDELGDACDDDIDDDGICGNVDNCPMDYNLDQSDLDDDGSGDSCDQCENDPGKNDPGV